MVYRVVSTKLTENEHTALLDECVRLGISPFAFVKESILEKLKGISSLEIDVPIISKRSNRSDISSNTGSGDNQGTSRKKLTARENLQRFSRLAK